MSNVGTTKLAWQTEPTLHFPSDVNCVVPTLDMAYPSPSCLCNRPTLHFPSDVNCVVPKENVELDDCKDNLEKDRPCLM
jgi:hypothetical protein